MEKSELMQGQNFRINTKAVLVFISVFIVVTILFAIVPLPGGDDWGFFRGAVHQMLSGKSVYIERYNNSLYHYPPWVAAILIPLGLMPFNWGWALISTLGLLFAVLVSRHFNMNLRKQVLVLLSPPMLYILLHGQIDTIALAFLLLPRSWWLFGCITKPQVTLGLIFGIPQKDWIKSIVIASCVFLLSFLVFGLWPIDLLRQPKEFAEMGLNIWGGLWPYQVPLGIVLVFRAWKQKDDRYLIACSPFFMPYAATSSLIGPWIALCSILEDWQAAIVLISWWAASFSRLL